MRKTCPRCGSDSRACPRPVAAGGTFGNYTCRDAWHMPAHTDEAQEALDIVAGLDSLVSGELLLSAETLAYNPYRHSTVGYPE